jgi:ketosteroid isomerase-like protein
MHHPAGRSNVTELSSRRRTRIDATCRELVRRLASALNRRDTAALASLLASELVWDMPDSRRLRSPAQVCLGYGDIWRRLADKGLWLDLDAAKTSRLEVESDCRARSSTWVVLYSSALPANRAGIDASQAELIGCCRHVFTRTRHGWRIAEHRSTRIWRACSPAALYAQAAGRELLA